MDKIIIIPDNATNEDVMKALFDIKLRKDLGYPSYSTELVISEPRPTNEFYRDWLDSPYNKKEIKTEYESKIDIDIDKAIEEVERQIICLTDGGNLTKQVLSLEKLVDIAHRYQKIEKIINEDFEEYYPLDRNQYKLSLIRKVVDNGNEN